MWIKDQNHAQFEDVTSRAHIYGSPWVESYAMWAKILHLLWVWGPSGAGKMGMQGLIKTGEIVEIA